MSRLDFESLSDEALVSHHQARAAGDNRAFREMFRRHHAMVWRVCLSFVRDAKDAEDLAQDVFFKAYRGLDGFKGQSKLKTWLYRIAVTTGQNELRRRSRRPQAAEGSIDDMSDRLTTGTSPERRILARSPSETLSKAMTMISADAAEVLQMKDVQQLTYEEIAERVGIGVSAAKMRVQRARLALRKAYAKVEEVSG